MGGRFLFFLLTLLVLSCQNNAVNSFGTQSKLKNTSETSYRLTGLDQSHVVAFRASGDSNSVLNRVFQDKNGNTLFVGLLFQQTPEERFQKDTMNHQDCLVKTIMVNNIQIQALLYPINNSWSYTYSFYEAESNVPIRFDLRVKDSTEAKRLFDLQPDYLSSLIK